VNLELRKNINGAVVMAEFGRFEFGKVEPSETYAGDRMTLEKGYVTIIRGGSSFIELGTEHIIAVIHLDKGQSVREIGKG
jgi:hypothetical protein